MSAVAENKGITPSKIEVHVEPVVEEERGSMRSRLVTHIDVGKGLTTRERIILFNSARRCEVHKLLTGPMDFAFELSDE